MESTAQEFRKLQQQALQDAERTNDPQARRGLLAFAALWERMAVEAEAAGQLDAFADWPSGEA